MRKVVLTLVALSILIPPRPALAAHFCTAETGTFVSVPLPPNPVDPARTHLYIHDRANNTGQGHIEEGGEGTWIYLENGRRPDEYNSGGTDLVGSVHDSACGAVCAPGSPCRPRTADDVIF